MANLKGLAAEYQPENTDTKSMEEWVEIAVTSNPALQARIEALAAAEKDVSTARAAYYPTLSASVNYGDRASWGQSNRFEPFPPQLTEFGSSSNGPSYGFTLSVPLFTGFATQSRVRQALL